MVIFGFVSGGQRIYCGIVDERPASIAPRELLKVEQNRDEKITLG